MRAWLLASVLGLVFTVSTAPDGAHAATPPPLGSSIAPVVLSVAVVPEIVAYGGSAKLNGRLTVVGEGVSGASLVIAAAADGEPAAEATTVTTDEDGAFTVTVITPRGVARTVYSVTFAGTSELAPVVAETTVRSQLGLAAPAAPISVGRATRFTTTGSLEPGDTTTDVKILCYRRESGAWVLRKTATAAVRAGGAGTATYSLRLGLAAGSWRLRALAVGGEYAPTRSRASTTIRVGSSADLPIWNRDGILTLPERMAKRRNAAQLIIARGSRLGSRTGTVYLFQYRAGDWVRVASMGARFGKRGLTNGRTRRSGTLTTPTGIWRMPRYVFGRRATPPSRTSIAYRRITWRSWWSAEKGSTYNRWVESSRRFRGEHLADYPVQYEYAVSTGYNARPNQRVYGRGTAIFLHVHGSGYTAGCVSLDRRDMLRVFRWLDSTKKPAFAIGTRRTGTATCITRY